MEAARPGPGASAARRAEPRSARRCRPVEVQCILPQGNTARPHVGWMTGAGAALLLGRPEGDPEDASAALARLDRRAGAAGLRVQAHEVEPEPRPGRRARLLAADAVEGLE